MFYKLIKLTNGENIIAATDSSCLNFKESKSISVIDPVLISAVKFSQGPFMIETYTMQPWIKLAKKDIIDIPTENIIVAVDVEDSVKEQYEKFLEDYQTDKPVAYTGEVYDEILTSQDEYFDEDDEIDDTESQTLH